VESVGCREEYGLGRALVKQNIPDPTIIQ